MMIDQLRKLKLFDFAIENVKMKNRNTRNFLPSFGKDYCYSKSSGNSDMKPNFFKQYFVVVAAGTNNWGHLNEECRRVFVFQKISS